MGEIEGKNGFLKRPNAFGAPWPGLDVSAGTHVSGKGKLSFKCDLNLEAQYYIRANPHHQLTGGLTIGGQVGSDNRLNIFGHASFKWLPDHNWSLAFGLGVGGSLDVDVSSHEPFKFLLHPFVKMGWKSLFLKVSTDIIPAGPVYGGTSVYFGLDLWRLFSKEDRPPLPPAGATQVIRNKGTGPLVHYKEIHFKPVSGEAKERNAFREKVAALYKIGYRFKYGGIAHTYERNLKKSLFLINDFTHWFRKRFHVQGQVASGLLPSMTPYSYLISPEGRLSIEAHPSLIGKKEAIIRPIQLRIDETRQGFTVTLWNWLEDKPFFRKTYSNVGRKALWNPKNEKERNMLFYKRKEFDKLIKKRHSRYGKYRFPKAVQDIVMAIDNHLGQFDVNKAVARYVARNPKIAKSARLSYLYDLVPASQQSLQAGKQLKGLYRDMLGIILKARPDTAEVDRSMKFFMSKVGGITVVSDFMRKEVVLPIESKNILAARSQVININGTLEEMTLVTRHEIKIPRSKNLMKGRPIIVGSVTFMGVMRDQYGNIIRHVKVKKGFATAHVLYITPSSAFVKEGDRRKKKKISLDLTGLGSAKVFRNYSEFIYVNAKRPLGRSGRYLVYSDVPMSDAKRNNVAGIVAKGIVHAERDFGVPVGSAAKRIYFVNSYTENASYFRGTVTIRSKILSHLRGKYSVVPYHEAVHAIDNKFKLSSHPAIVGFFNKYINKKSAFFYILNENIFIGKAGGHSQDNPAELLATLANSLNVPDLAKKLREHKYRYRRVLMVLPMISGGRVKRPVSKKEFYRMYAGLLVAFKKAIMDRVKIRKSPIITKIDKALMTINKFYPDPFKKL